MDNPEEVLHILDEFAKLKPKDIPKELEDYLSYVARTGDPVYQWSLVKCLFREKLLRVITDFYESAALINPPSPAGDNFNYEAMKRVLLERLETFSNAPFTVQRLCELLTAPRKQYNRTDKFMRAIEKNILVVSTREPGSACRQDNALSEPLPNGVSDGETLNQSVKNETVHLAEAHLNDNEEGTLNEENHVDIGSIEPEEAVATVAPKDLETVNADLSNSSEDLSGVDKQISEPGLELEDESSKTPVGNEVNAVHQNELVEKTESSLSSNPTAHSAVESSEEAVVEEQDGPEEQPVEQPLVQEELKEESKVESVKEDADNNENDIVCESKSDGASAEQVTEDSSEAIEKPVVEESDVSCSTSDSSSWPHTLPEEQDGVSTTEASSVESSSEVVQDSVLPAEAIGATSSEDAQEVLPESSETSEVESVKTSETVEAFKDIGSSSDSLVSTDNGTKEEDGVGTSDTAVVDQPLAATSEESRSQSPVTEEAHQPDASSEVSTEVEESTAEATPVPETNAAEAIIEVPVVSHEIEKVDSKSVDVSSATESCPVTETSKEAAPAVPEEAMDVDDSNSCHSTGAGAMDIIVAEESELMDDSE